MAEEDDGVEAPYEQPRQRSSSTGATVSQPWNQVGRHERVKEIRMGEPATRPDELLFHHRDMCGWSAKVDRAKPQKRQSDLLQLRVGVEAQRNRKYI
jgi:hypothetical protein